MDRMHRKTVKISHGCTRHWWGAGIQQ